MCVDVPLPASSNTKYPIPCLLILFAVGHKQPLGALAVFVLLKSLENIRYELVMYYESD